tara:strand:+ start:2349 stop:3362 length:1014 start_codon:yes stop_codon:yes gene_type:complete
MARSYVDSILDAAAMASRQDTLGDMLNQIPGLLVQQQQARQEREDRLDRQAKEDAFRERQFTSTENARKSQNELALGGAFAGIADLDERLSAFENYEPTTEDGVAYKKANIEAIKTGKSTQSAFNLKIKNYQDGAGQRTSKENLALLRELEIEASGSANLKKYVPSIQNKIKFQTGLGSQEFISNISDTIIFDESVSAEEQKKYKDMLKSATSVEQAKIVLDMIPTKDNKKTYTIEDVNLAMKYTNEAIELAVPGAEQFSRIIMGRTAELLGVDAPDVITQQGQIVDVDGQDYMVFGSSGNYEYQMLDDFGNVTGERMTLTDEQYNKISGKPAIYGG